MALALTTASAATGDFSDWLKDGSPLTFDVAFHLSTKLPTGEVVHETIRAHKAFLAKASPVFKKMFFDQEVESGANNASVVSDITVVEEKSGEGQNGVDAFKIILNSIYGKKIDMESIDSIHLLAHVARFANKYEVEEVCAAAEQRLAALVDLVDGDTLTNLSVLAAKYSMDSLGGKLSAKIKAMAIKELNCSVSAKLDSLEAAGVEEKMAILRGLADLAINHNVPSLQPVVAVKIDAILVNDENFGGLVALADSSQLMEPLRKLLARHLREKYSYTEELAYFLKSQQNLDINPKNLVAVLREV